MAKKNSPRQDAPPPHSLATASERVSWLLEHLWSGNRSQMARDIGVSHSVLAKIAAGTQSAGRRLLGAIASHPKVNPGWLLTGQGEPLLAASTASPADGWPLPISRQLLWLRPSEQREFFTGETFPVPGALYRETRYWLRVLPANSLVQLPLWAVRPHDLLLMETDPAYWASAEQIDELICAVRRPNELHPRLGQFVIKDEPETGWRMLSFSDFDTQAGLRMWRQTQAGEVPRVPAAPSRAPAKPATPPARKSNRLPPPPIEVELQSVVAACLALVRQFPFS